MSYVTADAGWGWSALFDVHPPHATALGTIRTEIADRIVELLNRHGLEDCSTADLAAALTDIEQRGN